MEYYHSALAVSEKALGPRHHLQVWCRPHHLQHHGGQVQGPRGGLAHRLTRALSRRKRYAEAGLGEAWGATSAFFLLPFRQQAVFDVNLTSMVLTVNFDSAGSG